MNDQNLALLSQISHSSNALERETQRLRHENLHLRQQLVAFETSEAQLTEARQQNRHLLAQIQHLQSLLEEGKQDSAFESQELEIANTELERTQQELVESKKKARRESDEKDSVLATVSHELRTPINSLIGMVGLILSDPLPSIQRDRIVTLRSSAEELLLLLNDMLDYSRLQSGQLKTERTFFRPQVLAEETATLMAPNAHRKGVEFCFHFHPDIPAGLLGDPFRLRQVLLNLLDNAIKFTDRGHVLLKVELERQEARKVWLRFVIRDTGIGLTQDAQQRVFDAFTQASSSTARVFGGSGLGLTISHQIVELLGGELCLESEVGKGTSLHFSVPFDVEAERASIHLQQPVRILLLRSANNDLAYVESQLKELGHMVLSVGSFQEALHLLKEGYPAGHSFDVLLMEQQEEQLEWQPFWYALRLHPGLRQVAVWLMKSPEQREQEDFRPDAFLRKPVLTSQLQNVITRFYTRNLHFPMLPAPTARAEGPVPLPSLPSRKVGTKFPTPVMREKQTLRVLVVEDNLVNQKVAYGLLTRLGCEVETASNGEEALEMVTHQTYDLIFMDCRMPKMDGFATTRALREELGSEVPIVAMTANVMDGDRERCLQAGMSDYLTKPMRPETLKSVLERWL